jgi:hypothetical protein
MNRFPFRISGVFQGLARTEGVARFDRDSISLELETRDTIFGIIRSGLREISIPAGDLASIKMRSGPFRTRLHIFAKRMRTFSRIPGHSGTELVLTFSAKLKTELKLAVSNLMVRITEYEIEEIERDGG